MVLLQCVLQLIMNIGKHSFQQDRSKYQLLTLLTLEDSNTLEDSKKCCSKDSLVSCSLLKNVRTQPDLVIKNLLFLLSSKSFQF